MHGFGVANILDVSMMYLYLHTYLYEQQHLFTDMKNS